MICYKTNKLKQISMKQVEWMNNTACDCLTHIYEAHCLDTRYSFSTIKTN